MLVAGAAWQLRAAYSAGAREREVYAREIADYLHEQGQRSFAVSPAVRRLMSDSPAGWDANVVADPQKAEAYVFVSNEVSDWQLWVANRPGTYRTVAGSREVNFDYYPSWAGPPRVLEVTIDVRSAA